MKTQSRRKSIHKEGKCKQTEQPSPKQCHDVNRMLPKPSLGPPESSLIPPVLCQGFGHPHCSELGCQLWLHMGSRDKKASIFPGRKVPRGVGAGFTHNSHSRTTPALGHQLAPAAERKAQKSPSHPWVFRGCVSSCFASSPFKLYKPELPPWLCVQCVSLCLHCCELFANFWEVTPLSTPLGLCKEAEMIQSLWSFTSQQGNSLI